MKSYEMLIHEFPDGSKLVLDTRSEEEIERERYLKEHGKFLAAQQRLLEVLNSLRPPKEY